MTEAKERTVSIQGKMPTKDEYIIMRMIFLFIMQLERQKRASLNPRWFIVVWTFATQSVKIKNISSQIVICVRRVVI